MSTYLIIVEPNTRYFACRSATHCAEVLQRLAQALGTPLPDIDANVVKLLATGKLELRDELQFVSVYETTMEEFLDGIEPK